MDYEFLIQQYLDGELDAAGESQLFNALSSNEELRKQMKDAIALDKGLSKRVSAFVPSSAATMNIFTQLGIGTAVGAASTAAALGWKGALLAFFSTHSAAIISAVVAVALTAGSFLTFYNPPDNVNLTGQKQTEYRQINNGNRANKPPSVISRNTDDKENNYVPIRVDTVFRYITRTVTAMPSDRNEAAVQSSSDMAKNNLENGKQDEQILLLQSSTPDINTNLNSQEMQRINTVYPESNSYTPMPVNAGQKGNLGVSFELKGNGYWSIPHADVVQYETPAFANIQLSALYAFSNKFKAGADVRQENFYQNFSGTNEIGEEFEYKQYPSYYTFSVFGRYTFLQKQNYGLFAQASLGATTTGGVSRLMFGLELSPFSSISFLLGVEGSMLTYIHQNNIFNSPKIGLNYGVAFNF
jgi:hypothetical protein